MENKELKINIEEFSESIHHFHLGLTEVYTSIFYSCISEEENLPKSFLHFLKHFMEVNPDSTNESIVNLIESIFDTFINLFKFQKEDNLEDLSTFLAEFSSKITCGHNPKLIKEILLEISEIVILNKQLDEITKSILKGHISKAISIQNEKKIETLDQFKEFYSHLILLTAILKANLR